MYGDICLKRRERLFMEKKMNINSSIVEKSNLTMIGLWSRVRPPGPLICFRIISAGNNKTIF